MGSHTVEFLLQRGFSVRCLVRRSRPDLGWIRDLPVEIFRGSYYDLDSLKEASRDVEYVLHIAGVTKAKLPREYREGNVMATKNLLEAVQTNPLLKKFAYVSSLAAAGPSLDGTPLSEDSPSAPITTYGVTKLEAETVCHLYAKNTPIVILRPPAVYGPRDSDILEILRWVNKGIMPVLGSADKRLSLIYGPELARAIVEATLSDRTEGETYFVSEPTIYLLTDALHISAKILGRRTVKVHFPPPVLYAMAGASEFALAFSSRVAKLNVEKARDLLQTHWTCSPEKLRLHTGFQNQISLEEGLRATIHWYKDFGWL